jgi:hypothetical protein
LGQDRWGLGNIGYDEKATAIRGGIATEKRGVCYSLMSNFSIFSIGNLTLPLGVKILRLLPLSIFTLTTSFSMLISPDLR